MGELKFSCPACGQHIQCDDQWSGQQIPCPACQTGLIVPQITSPASAPQAAPPTSQQPSQLRISTMQREAQPASHVSQAPSTRGPMQKPGWPTKKRKPGGALKLVKVAAIVVVVGVGFYFGFGWLRKVQAEANAKARELAKESDGGELGHAATLYSVLDATDPNRFSQVRGGATAPDVMDVSRMASGDGTFDVKAATAKLPVIAPVWTLDLTAAKIPQGRANGTLSGTNFIPDTVRVDVVGSAHVLSLRQGPIVSPDRQLLVYLHLKPGESPGGQSWTVSPDMTGDSAPQVAKFWKTNPKYAPVRRNYNSGYAMKLEFGQMHAGVIPGRIFISLPDTEQSVVSGVFYAETAVPGMQMPTPAAAPPQSTQPVAGGQPVEERYGIVTDPIGVQ